MSRNKMEKKSQEEKQQQLSSSSSSSLSIPSDLDNLKENLIKLRSENDRNNINNYKDDDKNNTNLLLSIKLKSSSSSSSSSSRPFPGLIEECYQWSTKVLLK